MRLLVFIAICLLTGPVVAAEFVAVGHVEQVTLLPLGSKRCHPCKSSTGQVLCITNSCGCGEATIAVDHVLLGKRPQVVLVKYPLSEWCDAGFSLSNPKVLIQLGVGKYPEWGQVRRLSSGEYVFATRRFKRIGSVEVSTLQQKDGWASLRELEARLGR